MKRKNAAIAGLPRLAGKAGLGKIKKRNREQTPGTTKGPNLMKILIIASLVSLMATPASATETAIEMLNSKNGENLVFSEKFTKLAKGDTVIFKATKPGHNAEFIPGGFPQGAEELHGAVGKDVSYTFNTPGLYLVRCAPHYGMGMIAVIEVDAPTNLDQIKQVYLPGKVRTVVDEQLKKAQM